MVAYGPSLFNLKNPENKSTPFYVKYVFLSPEFGSVQTFLNNIITFSLSTFLSYQYFFFHRLTNVYRSAPPKNVFEYLM